jgi:hypothetical protein
MVRKTPRPPEEARAIARALRKRFISAEVEATALEALKRLNIDPAEISGQNGEFLGAEF